MKTNIHFKNYLAHFLLEWEMFETKFIEKTKTHFFLSVMYLRKSCRLWDNVKKYGRAKEATDDNMAHAQYMLDN
jgi:hypothetical protein